MFQGIGKLTLAYPVPTQGLPAGTRNSCGYVEVKWNPVETLVLRRLKGIVVSFVTHFPLCEADVKFLGNSEQNCSPRLVRLRYTYWKLILRYNGKQ